jgi:osmotically-inducible protein OsmY
MKKLLFITLVLLTPSMVLAADGSVGAGSSGGAANTSGISTNSSSSGSLSGSAGVSGSSNMGSAIDPRSSSSVTGSSSFGSATDPRSSGSLDSTVGATGVRNGSSLTNSSSTINSTNSGVSTGAGSSAGISGNPLNRGSNISSDSISDQGLSTQIRQSLSGNNQFSDLSGIQIEAENGHVTLKGNVRSEFERAQIMSKVRSIAGVNTVDNQLEIRANR